MWEERKGYQGTTENYQSLRTYKIRLKDSQKDVLAQYLPHGISLQRISNRYMLEITELEKCKELRNNSIQSQKLRKQSLWMANLSQSASNSSSQEALKKTLIEVPVTKKGLLLELVQKLKQTLEDAGQTTDDLVLSWQSLEEKVQKWKFKRYYHLLDYIEEFINKTNDSNCFGANPVLFSTLISQISKTRELLGLFKHLQTKIYMLKEIEVSEISIDLGSHKQEDKENGGNAIEKEKQEKRQCLKQKRQRKRNRKSRKETMSETTLAPVLEESQSETNAEHTISCKQTAAIYGLLKKLSRVDQEQLLLTLSSSQSNVLIRNLKKNEANCFLAKIKQTIRRNGLSNHNITDCKEEEQSSFEVESESD